MNDKQYINEVSFKSLTNWSAGAILSTKLLYKEGFSLEPIRNVILRNREKEIIEDHKLYKQVTIRLYGKGVEQRGDELVLGKTIGTKNQFRISEGQFIMSKIDARNGAFGIVPKDLEGAITTQDFLSYNINADKILPGFFVLITSSKYFYELCQRASSGTTGRQRVDESAFLEFKIPVPDKIIQIALMKKYNEKIKLALNLINEIEEIQQNVDKLFALTLGLPKSKERLKSKQINIINFKDVYFWGVDKILGAKSYVSSIFPIVSLEYNPELYTEAFRGKSPKYDSNGKNVILNQKCNRFNSIELKHAKKVNDKWYSTIDEKLFTVAGDILINSTGEGTIGRASLITQKFAGLTFDSHLLLLRVNHEKLLAEYLVFLVNSDYGQHQIESLKSAKTTQQTELGVQNLLRILFPLPKIENQVALMKKIKKLEDRIDQLRRESLKNKTMALLEFESAIFNMN